MKRTSLFLTGVIASLVILGLVGNVLADTYENFDSYPNGGTNVGPWVLNLNGTGATSDPCWQDTTFTPNLITGVYSDNYQNLGIVSRSHPNTYLFVFSPTCSGSKSALLTEDVNATGPSLNFTFYWRGHANAGGSNEFIQAMICGQTFGVDTAVSIPVGYMKVSFVAPSTAGTTCLVSIYTFTSSVSTSNGYYFLVDDATVYGGNALITPSNVVALNAQTRQTFNFLPYPTSSLQIQYIVPTTCSSFGLVQISSNVCQQNGITTSYSDFPLTGAHLLTYNVGNQYYRSLIPNSTSHVVVFLDDASKVVQYNFVVSDVSQKITSGAQIYIKSGATIVTSGYLDAQSSFAAALVPATYLLELKQGTSFFSELINLQAPSVAGPTTFPIQITDFEQPAGIGFVGGIAHSLAWSCSTTSLIAFYTDTTDLTTVVTATLYNQTATGTFQVGTQTVTGSIGSVQLVFTGISHSGSYSVLFKIINSVGTHFLGPDPVTLSNPSCPSTFPSIIPALPAFPISVFGLNQFLPNANAYSEIMALMVIFLVAGVWGARHSSLGYMITAFTVMWFFLALFIPSSYTILYTFIATSFTGFLVYRRRRSGVLGQ